MNKSQLVQRVAEQTGITKRQAGQVVNAVFDSIRSSLQSGNRVSLVGFGSFEVRQRKARQGRNPRTGQRLRINARRVPVFRAGRPLRDAVNKR
ncbi:MAG: HU family DNA-binding protein [Clostridia bacterium]|nr:HU family DNA-binding protein [Clostridia bacterium]